MSRDGIYLTYRPAAGAIFLKTLTPREPAAGGLKKKYLTPQDALQAGILKIMVVLLTTPAAGILTPAGPLQTDFLLLKY